MAVYYAAVQGDPLDNGGDSHVIDGASHATIEGPDGRTRGQTHLGQTAWCSVCKSVGVIAAGSGMSDYLRGWDGSLNAAEAVGGDIVLCNCKRRPRIVSVYGRCYEYRDVSADLSASSSTTNEPLPAALVESKDEFECYFEMVDARTDAPIEGMSYKLSSNGQSVVYDTQLLGGRTLACSLKEHPSLTFVAWREGNVR